MGDEKKPANEAQDESLLSDYIYGTWRSWMILASVKLNIAEHLVESQLDIDELAKLTGSHAPSLFRLMRALASFDIFKLNEDGKWSMTPMATMLTSRGKHSMKYAVLKLIENEYLAWAQLDKAIINGGSVFEEAYGMPFYDRLQSNPQSLANFKNFVKSITAIDSHIPDFYDFKSFKHIVDIGGNDGTFLELVLKSAPNAVGTLFDEMHVIEEAKKNLLSSEIGDRLLFAAGNFLENIPSGGDCYILKKILPDWNDENAAKIVSNIAKKMNPGNRLLIIEPTLPEDDKEQVNRGLDILLLCTRNGKQRKNSEIESLFRQCGLRLNGVIKTDSLEFPVEIIEAIA